MKAVQTPSQFRDRDSDQAVRMTRGLENAAISSLSTLIAGAGLLVASLAAADEAAKPVTVASPDIVTVEREESAFSRFSELVLDFQRRANEEIALHMNAIESGDDLRAFMLGLFIAFVYGVVHAFGPGHGKFVIVSYFLGREARIVRGVAMAVQIAIVHVVAAVVIVGLADTVLRSGFGFGLAEVPGVRAASFLIIVGIGLYMLYGAVRASRGGDSGHGHAHAHAHAHGQSHRHGHPHAHGHDHGDAHGHSHCPHGHPHDREHEDHGHAHGHGHSHDHGHAHGHGHSHGHGHAHGHPHHHGANVEGGILALAAGMVPCPGAVLIMLYAVANDMVYPGFLLVGAMSVGIGLSICALGVGAILARQTALRILERPGGGRGGRMLRSSMNYVGATFVTLIGLVSFVAFLDTPLQ